MNDKKVNSPIFMDKDVKSSFLMFHVLFSVPDEYQKKSFSSLKNISLNLI